MSEVIIPSSVRRAVARGPVVGYREFAERQPDGWWKVGLRRTSPVRYAPWTDDDGQRHITQLTPKEARPVVIPAEQVAAMKASLPPVVRREARERFAQLVSILFADATRSFYRDGRIAWPKSIEAEMGVIGAAQGKTSIVAQVEEMARRFIERAARQQQAQDGKRVTSDWSGHYSA